MTPHHGVCLSVAYDGTNFAGYQVQPGQRTIQGELERAAARLTGHPVVMRAAGRTDAGVHAHAQIIAFDSARLIPERGWRLGLDRHLPDDIRVNRAWPVPAGYNPRFDAHGKLYRYVMSRAETPNPLLRHRVWHLGKLNKVDVAVMRRAARMLEGTHTYHAFRAADDPHTNTVRTLSAIDLEEGYLRDPALLCIEVRGTAFMKNMVRILAGTLVQIGRGKIPIAQVPRLLQSDAARKDTGLTAPAHGLTLVEVKLGRKPLEAWLKARRLASESNR